MSKNLIYLAKAELGGSRFCDFFIYRDKKKLNEVLDKLINDEVKIVRDPKFIHENYQDTAQEFYEFWHNLLSQWNVTVVLEGVILFEDTYYYEDLYSFGRFYQD